MNNAVVSSIIELIIDLSKDAFSGFRGKIKLYKIRKKLKDSIFYEILEKYGDTIYYNELDRFLTKHDVICSIIRNCCEVPVFQYKSKSQTITYYAQLFSEQHPQYSRYTYEIRVILQKYFDVIFLTLNHSANDETRIICNITKELSQGLSSELQTIQQSINQVNKNLSALLTSPEEPSNEFFYDDYRKHLLCLYPLYPVDSYLERKIYTKDETDTLLNSLDVLLDKKRILLIGEAGFGKTYESIILLQKACTYKNEQQLIPVLFPLQEYGLLYPDIISGIKYKLSPFCQGNVDKIIDEHLKEGRYIFIFDGIDDITQELYTTKFYAEANNLFTQYDKNYYFITSRFNRYHGELGEKKQYRLTAINESTIRQELQKDGIVVKIPRHYYELFSNPFFLQVGKSILKQSTNREMFNRSSLFEELFQELYGRASQSREHIPLTYSEALNILGDLAYRTFSQPSYSYMEFDELISKSVSKNKSNIINSFVCSGVFKIENKVFFTHKLLKEYCVAYYLVNNLPLSQNIDLYIDLVKRDEWKEVFIFAGGIFKTIQAQDAFLDFVMEHNLPLYVECVKAKSDINETNDSKRLLTQILKTYKYILSKYFSPIVTLFDPVHPLDFFVKNPNLKIGIIGCLSSDKTHLNYWFDFISTDKDDVQCLSEQQLKDYYASSEKKVIHERRCFRRYAINLELSGLNEESGRKIAIDLIKKRLEDITNNKGLIESKYLLCERIENYKKKIKELKGIDNLVDMQTIIDKKINEALKTSPHLVGYNLNGVEIFPLRDLLHILNQSNTILSECILPGPDLPFPTSGSCYIWDLYSKEQKEKRISLFFYYHEASYLEMVETNFPNLKEYFKRYNDAPYQVIVEIDHNEDSKSNHFTFGPSLQHYYVASPTPEISMPLIQKKQREDFDDHDQIVQIIRDSYLKQGRVVNHIVTTQTGFQFIINSINSSGPLSDYVYRSIKESLKDIFKSTL